MHFRCEYTNTCRYHDINDRLPPPRSARHSTSTVFWVRTLVKHGHALPLSYGMHSNARWCNDRQVRFVFRLGTLGTCSRTHAGKDVSLSCYAHLPLSVAGRAYNRSPSRPILGVCAACRLSRSIRPAAFVPALCVCSSPYCGGAIVYLIWMMVLR